MSEQKQKNFPDGLIAKKPSENAAKFILAKLSIKKEDFLKWLNEQPGEWINLDITKSDKSKFGATAYVDDWQPNQQSATPVQSASYGSAPNTYSPSPYASSNLDIEYGDDEVNPDDIPFQL